MVRACKFARHIHAHAGARAQAHAHTRAPGQDGVHCAADGGCPLHAVQTLAGVAQPVAVALPQHVLLRQVPKLEHVGADLAPQR